MSTEVKKSSTNAKEEKSQGKFDKNDVWYHLQIMNCKTTSDPSYECWFQEKDIKSIEKMIGNQLMKHMLEWRCDGCHYCCYGTKWFKDKCEATFQSQDDFPRYFELGCHCWQVIEIDEQTFTESETGIYERQMKPIWSINLNDDWKKFIDSNFKIMT